MKVPLNVSVTIFIAILFPCYILAADTVMLNNGEREKGLILDEFNDRIVMSTIDGEKTIMKSGIRSALYDNEEKALMQKASNQVKRGQHIRAYYTYQNIIELNPEHEEARDRLHKMRSFLESKTRDDIIDTARSMHGISGDIDENIKLNGIFSELGMSLSKGDKYIFVDKIYKNNISKYFKPGDRIVSVWGEMAAYLNIMEVAEMLSGMKEVNLVIERTVTAELSSERSFFDRFIPSRYKNIIGADLLLEKKGVFVGKVAPNGVFAENGISEGDLIYRIEGKNTRYLPLSNIVDIIRDNKNDSIDIVIHRALSFWRNK